MNKQGLRDFKRMFVGQKLGGGAFRQVYEHLTDDKLVIKYEPYAKSFCNVLEWQLWDHVKWDDERGSLKHWLAPCVTISPCGTWLIQARVDPIGDREMPKMIPACLTDVKTNNYGRLRTTGKIVCVDYGFLPLGYSTKLKKHDPKRD